MKDRLFKKGFSVVLVIILLPYCIFAQSVVASTSWTGAFADLAGADNVEIIAPANLRHPPEYEITAGDVKKIANCDFFIYAGFERMMEELGEKVVENQSPWNASSQSALHQGPVFIKITCNNSIEAVTESVEKIANELGTVEESKKRLAMYVEAVEWGRSEIEKKGLKGARVYCNKNQIYLARELGFEIVDVFGPGPISSKEILNVKLNSYDFIIDNIHNPVGKPLKKVCPTSEYIIWRNFPEVIGRNSLINLIIYNIKEILK